MSLRQIEFLPLSENRILVILVDQRQGRAEPHPAHGPGIFTPDGTAAGRRTYINQHYAGDRNAARFASGLLRDLDATRDSMNQAMHDIIAVAHVGHGQGTTNPDGEFVLAGETNLMDFAELSDVENTAQAVRCLLAGSG